MKFYEEEQIAQRFESVKNASVRTPEGITALVDSVLDVPVLLEEIHRLRAEKVEIAESITAIQATAWERGRLEDWDTTNPYVPVEEGR